MDLEQARHERLVAHLPPLEQAQHARLRLLQAGQERGEHLVLRRVASAVGRREALGEQREVALQRRDVGRQPAHLAR